MARRFEADIRRDTRCPQCSAAYFYFHTVEVDEDDSATFETRIRDAVVNGVGVAPCPVCGAMSPEMKAAHVKNLRTRLLGVLASVAVLLFGLMMLEQGALFYILLPAAGLSLLYYVVVTLTWAFEPKTNRKHSIQPGFEDKASEKARGQLEAWKARQAENPPEL
jgi:hypothetical protein